MSNSHQSCLALFLLAAALSVAACGATEKETLTQSDAAHGRSLWLESTCVGCHGVEAEGSPAGPALVDTPLSLRDVINITRRGTPGMPEYPAKHISDQDLQDMYAWFQNPVPAATSEVVQNPWTQSSCAGCHGASALGGSGPSLAGTSQSFAAFEAVVREGSEGMPAYSPSEIGDAELGRIYDWLQARAEVPAAPQSVWVATGCGGCHGPDAAGGSAAALTDEEISYDEFHQVVREGTEGMPAYSASQIGESDLEHLYDWLQAQAQLPAGPEEQWMETGCGGCHGPDAEGGSAPSLTLEEISYDEFQQVVRDGAEGMPAYSTRQIRDAELQRMYDWLQARAQPPVAPQTVWVETGCGGCHGPDGRGGSALALTGAGTTYDEFHRVVRDGAEGMPAYSPSQISDEEIQSVYDWLSGGPRPK